MSTPLQTSAQLSRRTFSLAMRDRFALILFGFSCLVFSTAYGYMARDRGWFPHHLVQQATDTLRSLQQGPIYIVEAPARLPQASPVSALAHPGVNVITSVTPNEELSIKITELDGKLIHEWNPDWFKIWPDATHVSEDALPKVRPGTHIHGTHLARNGDVTFNFERLGTVRLDPCNRVVWRLPYLSHHAIYEADNGNLWITADRDHNEVLDWLPSHKPPFVEPLVLEVSQDGKVVREISILELLVRENLLGLLLARAPLPWEPSISGDTLHLNDVEVFSSRMSSGFFKPGDIMISLRNIGTVLVMAGDTLDIKFRSTGSFVGQHDPDFVDGNTISVFDNNNSASEKDGVNSRIVQVSAPSGDVKIVYEGTPEHPFFTHKMGKHQLLENGNLLVTETFAGRVFEVAPSGEIVWEFVNRIDDEHVSIVEGAQRLASHYAAPFAAEKLAQCNLGRL